MNEKRKMERKIYERALEDGTAEEYIENRKTQSALKFRERREKAERRRAIRAEGREYVAKNHVPLYVGVIGNYAITAGVLLQTDKATNTAHYRVAYTICSPKDRYTLRIAEGHVGHRLTEEDNPYAFSILTGGGSIHPFRLMRLIETHIQMDMLAPRVPGPNRLIQMVTKTQPYFRMVQVKEEKDYEKEKPNTLCRHSSGHQKQVSQWHVLYTLWSESADVSEKSRLTGSEVPNNPVPFATVSRAGVHD